MLEIHGKIHDKYTLEFKVGYSRGHKEMSVSNFVMDTWIFIPDALYINDKNIFYPNTMVNENDIVSFKRCGKIKIGNEIRKM